MWQAFIVQMSPNNVVLDAGRTVPRIWTCPRAYHDSWPHHISPNDWNTTKILLCKLTNSTWTHLSFLSDLPCTVNQNWNCVISYQSWLFIKLYFLNNRIFNIAFLPYTVCWAAYMETFMFHSSKFVPNTNHICLNKDVIHISSSKKDPLLYFILLNSDVVKLCNENYKNNLLSDAWYLKEDFVSVKLI